MTEPTSDLVKVNAFARRFEKEIGEAVSKKFRHGALMTALVILRVVENILITNELTKIGDFYRDYLLRRLFQRQVELNIQKSLKQSKNTTAKVRRQKTI